MGERVPPMRGAPWLPCQGMDYNAHHPQIPFVDDGHCSPSPWQGSQGESSHTWDSPSHHPHPSPCIGPPQPPPSQAGDPVSPATPPPVSMATAPPTHRHPHPAPPLPALPCLRPGPVARLPGGGGNGGGGGGGPGAGGARPTPPSSLSGCGAAIRSKRARKATRATRGPEAQAAPSRREPEAEADREDGRGGKPAFPVAGDILEEAFFSCPAVFGCSGRRPPVFLYGSRELKKGAFRKADGASGAAMTSLAGAVLCPGLMMLLN